MWAGSTHKNLDATLLPPPSRIHIFFDIGMEGVPVEELYAEIPNDWKALRACLRCSLIKSYTQVPNSFSNLHFISQFHSSMRMDVKIVHSYE